MQLHYTTRTLIFLIFCLSLFIALPTNLNAQAGDTTPPVLLGFNFTPSTINVSANPQDVALTLHITDDLSGFASCSVTFTSPSGLNRAAGINVSHLVSGTINDGIYESFLTFSQFSEAGTWHVTGIILRDQLGQGSGNIGEADLVAMGFPTELEVISTSGDTTPPVLLGFNFTPSTINVSANPQDVALTLHITDDLSGFASCSVTFTSPSGLNRAAGINVSHLVSGTINDGIYESFLTFSQFSEAGTWHVTGIILRDQLGQGSGNIGEADLVAMGFPTELEVISTSGDTTPPVLLGFNFTPSTINVSANPQDVALTLHITDDLSGFASCSVTFTSPSGLNRAAGINVSHLVSGTINDGIYESFLTFSQFSEAGTWHVTGIILHDQLGQGSGNIGEADLIAMGFPTELEVISTPGDTTPPVLVDFSFSPTTVNVAVGAATVIGTVQFTDDISGVRTSDVVFRSPSGLQVSTSTHTLISGTANDGVHEDLIPIPQFSEVGIWVVSAVQLWDETGNTSRYLTDDLVALGFPTELEVVSEPAIDAILEFFDESVADGSLMGYGKNPWLAKLRLFLMREMLIAARELLEQEKLDWACFTINRADLRSDGEKRPKDFVIGEAVPALNDMISNVMADLECN